MSREISDYFDKTRTCGFYTTFDRPEVEKLRGHSGSDPREKSEVEKEIP